MHCMHGDSKQAQYTPRNPTATHLGYYIGQHKVLAQHACHGAEQSQREGARRQHDLKPDQLVSAERATTGSSVSNRGCTTTDARRGEETTLNQPVIKLDVNQILGVINILAYARGDWRNEYKMENRDQVCNRLWTQRTWIWQHQGCLPPSPPSLLAGEILFGGKSSLFKKRPHPRWSCFTPSVQLLMHPPIDMRLWWVESTSWRQGVQGRGQVLPGDRRYILG